MPLILVPLCVQGPNDLWMVYVSTFLLATGEALYAPIRMAMIPEVVKQERLMDVNAIEQSMIGIILVVGASIGGLLSYYVGLSFPFLLNGVTFLLSALILSKVVIARNRSEKLVRANNGEKYSSKKVIAGSAALLAFMVIALTMPMANGIDNVLISVYALDVFKMGEIGVGFMYAALGIGFIVSTFFSNVLKRRWLVLTVIFIALEGLGHVVLSVAPNFSSAIFIVMFITLFGGLSNICIDTVMKFLAHSN